MSHFLGEIRMFSGDFAPDGWALCNNQLLSITEHGELFTLLGTRYGGDGVTTFCVPEMRGRFPMHTGNGPGLPKRNPEPYPATFGVVDGNDFGYTFVNFIIALSGDIPQKS